MKVKQTYILFCFAVFSLIYALISHNFNTADLLVNNSHYLVTVKGEGYI